MKQKYVKSILVFVIIFTSLVFINKAQSEWSFNNCSPELIWELTALGARNIECNDTHFRYVTKYGSEQQFPLNIRPSESSTTSRSYRQKKVGNWKPTYFEDHKKGNFTKQTEEELNKIKEEDSLSNFDLEDSWMEKKK